MNKSNIVINIDNIGGIQGLENLINSQNGFRFVSAGQTWIGHRYINFAVFTNTYTVPNAEFVLP